MISREIYLKNIADSLALLSKEVTMRNAINLYDINIIAEDFFPGLLNIIYGFELINVNHFKKMQQRSTFVILKISYQFK